MDSFKKKSFLLTALLLIISVCFVSCSSTTSSSSTSIAAYVSSKIVSTLAGTGYVGYTDGVGTTAAFYYPYGVTYSTVYNTLFIADTNNNVIRVYDLATGQVTTLAGDTKEGYINENGKSARFRLPFDLVAVGTSLYIADTSNNCIRKIDLTNGNVTTFAGTTNYEDPGFLDGIGTSARFRLPEGITADPSGNFLYVCDTGNHAVRKIEISTATVTTLAGNGTYGYQDGFGTNAKFHNPMGLTVDNTNTSIYLCDALNHRIRKIVIATGEVTTFAGKGTPSADDGFYTNAGFNLPRSLTFRNGLIYVTDTGNNLIRQITVATGEVIKIAGTGAAGNYDGKGEVAQFYTPGGITTDPSGAFIYLMDSLNYNLRLIQDAPPGKIRNRIR